MMTRVNLSNSNWDINVSLNEEEAAAMRCVLERDSRLRRAERQRVQKLREVSRDDRWLWGVSGQWFQEIKKANREYNSSSGCCSPASFSISKTRSKERRITAKEKNEEHTKTTGIPLRTRLASLFSFRLPQKKNHSKLNLARVALRSRGEAERYTQLAVPDEVTIVDATNGDAIPEEDVSGDIILGKASSVEIISRKDSVGEIVSGEIIAVEFAHKEAVHRKASLGKTIPGKGTAMEFIHEEVTYRQASPGKIILSEVSPHQVSHWETTARESIAGELAHSELQHKENSLDEHSAGEIIPGKTTTGESAYREASSVEISQKYLPGEASDGEIIHKKAAYGEAITKEVALRDVIPEKSSCAEIIPGENVPGEATAREIIPGETTTEKIDYEVVTHRKASFGELVCGDSTPRETTSREVTSGEITAKKVLPGEFIPGELTFKETITEEVTLREIIPGKALCGKIIPVETVPGKTSRKKSRVTGSLRESVDLSREAAFSGSLKESTVTCSLRESVDLLRSTTVTDSMRVPIELSRESAFPGVSIQSTVFDSVRQSTLSGSLTPSRLIGSFMESTLSHSLKEFIFRDSLIQSEDSPQQYSGPFLCTEQTPKPIYVDVGNNQRSFSSRQHTIGLATKKSKRYPRKATRKLEGNKIQNSDCTDIAPHLRRESHWHSTPDFRLERGRFVTVNSVHCSRPTRHERMATGPELPAICDLTHDSGLTGSLRIQYKALSGTQSWATGCSDRRIQTSQLPPVRSGFNPLAFKESDSDSTTDDEYYLSPDRGEKETCL